MLAILVITKGICFLSFEDTKSRATFDNNMCHDVVLVMCLFDACEDIVSSIRVVVEVDRSVCISVHSGTNFIQVCFQNVGNANENLYFVSKSSFFFHLAVHWAIGRYCESWAVYVASPKESPLGFNG
uniref:Uncharacterized protein n=1 Tax=Zea mays TaxID=4577 RepID=A0A804RVQ2_MAIZE